MPIYSANPNVKRFFNKYDMNRDGRLDKNELKEAFKQLGAYFPSWRAARALKFADANGDGFITLDEANLLIDYIITSGYTIKDV